MKENILTIPREGRIPQNGEWEENILRASNISLKRIISCGYASPKGFWYDQSQDEWLVLVQGRADLVTKDVSGTETLWRLRVGDSMFLKAGQKHRIQKTCDTVKTIWLVLYGEITLDKTENHAT